jgi:hypothetical protein
MSDCPPLTALSALSALSVLSVLSVRPLSDTSKGQKVGPNALSPFGWEEGTWPEHWSLED